MSRNLSASFAGMCGSLMVAGAASAQELSQDTTFHDTRDISPEWRVTINPQDSLIRRPQTLLPEESLRVPSTISIDRDFQISERSGLRLRFEAESNGLQGFADMIRSGGLPFSGRNSETGGSWGMKFKRGASIQYRFRW